jgi:hypothetical protein
VPGNVLVMDDLGPPVAYLVLPSGVPVYDRDGTAVGTVEHVLADEAEDIFHGLIVRTPGSGQRYLFADRDQVGSLHRDGVVLAAGHGELRDVSQDPSAREAADELPGNRVESGLRRAWEWLSRPR